MILKNFDMKLTVKRWITLKYARKILLIAIVRYSIFR